MTTPPRIVRLWGIDLTRVHQSDSQRIDADAAPTYGEASKGAQATPHTPEGAKKLEDGRMNTGGVRRFFTTAVLYFQMAISSFPIR